jgi:hypothetical protein
MILTQMSIIAPFISAGGQTDSGYFPSCHIVGARKKVLCLGYPIPKRFVTCIALGSHFCQRPDFIGL